MSDITPKKSIDINLELGNLQQYRYHPNAILNASLNRLKDITDGRVELSDPSNPFVYLLETSALNTAFAIQEMTLLTRKLYPRLANSEDDLYLHMSDKDYKDRFSTPSKARVRFNILYSDFKTHAYRDPVSKDYLHTIPRNLMVTIDKYVYTLTAPISIRLTESGITDIRYVVEKKDDLFDLETGFIDFEMWSINQDEKYISFEVTLPEVELEATEVPVEKSKLFKGNLLFNSDRRFYYFKAFHLTNQGWRELVTTHTEQVYDISTPTCIVKVNQLDNRVEYYIPPVYLQTGRLGDKVKFVVYTTLGPVNVNFGDFKIDDFSFEYNQVFPELELDKTTEALNLISKKVSVMGRVVGGKGPKTFSRLKRDVISNNLGRDNTPITNVHIESFLDNSDFKLVRNVDVVTNRMFLLEATLPRTVSRYDISNLNLDIVEYKTSVSDLRDDKNSIKVINPNVTLIPEKTLFEVTHDGLTILDNNEFNFIESLSDNNLIKEVNSRRLVETYYHYVLDTSGDTTVLRAYDISDPAIERINFSGFNATTRIGMNSIQAELSKIDTGYRLDVLSSMKKYDETLSESNIIPFLIYRTAGDAVFFLEGRLYAMSGDYPVFRFGIDSDYFIDSDNKIEITNFRDNNGSLVSIKVDLDTKLELMYVSNRVVPGFQAGPMDSYLYGSYLLPGKSVVSIEELDTTFGKHLEYLYTRVHTSTGIEEYERWEENVPALYDRTIYGPDNDILHHRGEEVLDEEGNPIYVHREGDIKLGEDGKPLLKDLQDPQRYLNIMFMDYRASLANNEELVQHRDYLKKHLTKLITEDVKDIQPKLLENTVAYMTVPTNLQDVIVNFDGKVGYVPSAQSFKITVYVDRRNYEDTEARRGIESILKDELETYITTNRVLSRSVIVSKMLERANEYIRGVNITDFTSLEADYIELPKDGDRLTFDKTLSAEPDGYRLRDKVEFTFVQVS